MYSVTWKQLVNQVAKTLECYKFMQGQNIVNFVDEQIQNYAGSAYGAKVWGQNDYLSKILGKKVVMYTANPASFASMYSMKFTDTSETDEDVSFLCVRVEQDITAGAGFTNTFAEVNYVKEGKK